MMYNFYLCTGVIYITTDFTAVLEENHLVARTRALWMDEDMPENVEDDEEEEQPEAGTGDEGTVAGEVKDEL